MIVERFPLTRNEDERGWFSELARASAMPRPFRQANLSWSRRGVIRGLHYHERGQDDLFVCLAGTVRVVVLDRASGETYSEDIGEDNPVAIYVPGRHAHGYEALTDALFMYLVTEEYDATDPDEIKHRPGPGGTSLSYVDARYVMDVLDGLVGPHNWQDQYVDRADGSVRCGLSINVEGPMAFLLGWIVMRVSRKFLPMEAAALKQTCERA